MPVETQNGIPAYQRIQNAIREQIELRNLRPGDAVDSERELAKVHQVSLMTARHALACLEREGVVQRRPGAGTFVAPPRIHFNNKLMSYTEQMASRALAPCSKIIVSKVITNEDEVAVRLNLPAASRMVKIERVRHTADEPFALETCGRPSKECRYFLRSSSSMGFNSPMPMKKLMPPRPMLVLQNCSRYPAALRFFACGRLSIPQRANR